MSHPGRQYEFSAEDNATIGRLAHRMRSVGFWFELYGVVLIVVFVVQMIPWKRPSVVSPVDLLTGMLFMFLGIRTWHGAKAFQKIVTTEGRDVGHLMEALGNLTHFYTLIDRVILVVLVLAILLAIIVAVAM